MHTHTFLLYTCIHISHFIRSYHKEIKTTPNQKVLPYQQVHQLKSLVTTMPCLQTHSHLMIITWQVSVTSQNHMIHQLYHSILTLCNNVVTRSSNKRFTYCSMKFMCFVKLPLIHSREEALLISGNMRLCHTQSTLLTEQSHFISISSYLQ